MKEVISLIVSRLKKCYIYINLPGGKQPTDEQSVVIAETIVKYYGDLNTRDIEDAFELSSIGRIQVDLRHFQSVGVNYIVNILNAYREYRNRLKRELEDRLSIYRTDYLEEYLINCYKNDRAIKSMLIGHYYKFLKDGKKDGGYMNYQCFDFLKLFDKISYTEERRNELVDLARKHFEIRKRELGNGKLLWTETDVINKAKVMVLYDFFEDISNYVSWIEFGKIIATVGCMIPESHALKVKHFRYCDEESLKMKKSILG